MGIYEYILAILAIIVSAVISIIALIFAHSANKQSKTANNLAEEANKKSDISNGLAIEANDLSKKANNYSKAANDLAKSANHKANRPKLNLVGLFVDYDEIDVYVGNNVNLYGSKPIKKVNPIAMPLSTIDEDERFIEVDSGYDFTNLIVSSRRSVFLTPYAPYEEEWIFREHSDMKEYLFINLCATNNVDNVILVFGLMDLVIDLDSDNVSELKIENVYSMRANDTSIKNDMRVAIQFSDPKFPLTIPIAVAYPKRQEKRSWPNISCGLENICFKIFQLKDKNEKRINLLKNRDMLKIFKKHIGLSELSCLLKCTTASDDEEPYYYTLMFRTHSYCHTSHLAKIYYGGKQFYKMAIEATRRAGKNVIF